MATQAKTIIPIRSSDKKKTEINFKLSKPPGDRYPFYPPSEIIPCICEILYLDQETGEKDQRTIAYVPGRSSIFIDEWSDEEKKAIYGEGKRKKLKGIKFTNGFKIVGTSERNLLNYLRYAGYNKANDDTRMPDNSALYLEEDYEANNEKIITARKDVVKAQYFVNEAPIEDVRAFALALCENKSQVDQISVMDEYSVRAALLPVAEKKPQTFIEGLTDKELKNKVYIIKALQIGIITEDSKSSKLSWEDGDVFVEAPKNMPVIDWFADLATKTTEYSKVLDLIKEFLEEEKPAEEENKTWQERMVDEAIDAGRMEKNGNWYIVPGDEGEDPIYKSNGLKNLLEDLSKKDNVLLNLIR